MEGENSFTIGVAKTFGGENIEGNTTRIVGT